MNRDYYKVMFTYKKTNRSKAHSRDVLDNDTEFNANQFKLYDDFSSEHSYKFTTLRNFHEVVRNERQRCDPNDSGIDLDNGNPTYVTNTDSDLLENEVMVDPWSSMDSSNSPLTDSGPSASEECTPSTSSEPPRGPLDASSPISPDTRRLPDPKDTRLKYPRQNLNKPRTRDLTLDLESDLSRRPHFLDDDYQLPSKSNIECRIPKPHFLDHSPSPDEFDERSDITNPNFLDDEVDADDNQAQKKSGALPKRTNKPQTSYTSQDERPHRTNYRSTLHYGLESAARSSERDKRASQLFRGTWPGERDVWTAHDSGSVRSFSSNGSDGPRPSSNLENKMECVCSLISLLSLSPENNADLSEPLLEMSRSIESCIAMRQAGCIPLLVQLIHSKVPRETRDRAAKALRNIIHTQKDDKAGRREARVWRLLEQVREYCYVLEGVVEARKEGKEAVEDDATKHPSQSVAALMKLSFDEEHRHVVCQLGGLQALAALVSGDQAAHGSRTDDNTCITMRKYAGMTLTNLTFGDGNNKSLLCSFKDFMLALVEQLESPNDDMRQVTAAVLRNLSWRADTNSKQVLREVGAVKGLTKAAMTCQKEATLKSVLSALWNLTAHCSMNKVALCSVDGALGFLVDMLSYNSPTKTLAIVENAGGIMRNVSSHIAVREDYRQILRERNCLSVLLQHLKSPSLTVVSNSCGTLWNLSARCPQDQQFLWDHGAVPMLRSLIHSKHKMIAMGSSAALKNLLNSKPGKTHIISLDTTARSMNLPALPTLVARKQKALEQELDQNLAETCDNIEPATSPTTSNRDEKNLFTATERQIAMNLERHRMTSSSPLMGTLSSQISLSHSAHLASYLSCSNTLLKGALVTRSTGSSSNNVNRSDSKDSVTSTHSDSVFERGARTGKVPVPTPRNKDLMKMDTGSDTFKSQTLTKDPSYLPYTQPPIPPPRSSTDMRTNYTESGYDVDQDSCDQPIDFSRKYSETKTDTEPVEKSKSESKKYTKKDNPNTFGDYQETDLDQPTDYSLRYAEHQSETGSDISEPPAPSVHEDTIKHFATEGTPYETPIIFSTATSMSDLRIIGKDGKPKTSSVKEHPEAMTHSDEKDTCSIEDPPRHNNDEVTTSPPQAVPEPIAEKRSVFDTKFSSGMISPEKPVNYCDEGTPGYFSRVSSLSSLGEPTQEDSLAKKNAQASINVDPSPQEQSTSSSGKDKEGSKAVTFATEAVSIESSTPPRFIEDTPLMFSRSSSLGSLPECSQQDDQGSVVSEISRLTSGCISPSEIPDSPGQSVPLSPRAQLSPRIPPIHHVELLSSVFEERPAQFVVENTPAHFSANTSLSSLTINDEPRVHTTLTLIYYSKDSASDIVKDGDSDSDPQSDGVLQACIERGIQQVVKHKGPPSDGSASYTARNDVYRSLPAHLRSSTETVMMSNDFRSVRESPPPLPPKERRSPAPPRPPPPDDFGRRQTERAQRTPKPKLPVTQNLVRNDSLSSLSLDSFGSTDREIFEETVKAGLSSVNPRAQYTLDNCKGKAHSAERRTEPKHNRHNRSLDRSDKITNRGHKVRDPEFERNIASGAYNIKPSNKVKKLEQEFANFNVARSSYSYHGEGSGTHQSRFRGHGRYYDDGPPSLPTRSDEPRRLDRSNSLSSLSNDSFGSTDKEVFERSVRIGMSKPLPKKKEEPKLRVRSDDRLEVRESHRRRRRDTKHQGALDKMVGEEYSKDRAILEEVIARGAGETQSANQSAQSSQSKNVEAPSAGPAAADDARTARDNIGSDDSAIHTMDDIQITINDTPISIFDRSNEMPTVDSGNTTLDSDCIEMDKSNECLAPASCNTTVESDRDELNRSNESYADVLDGSWSEDEKHKEYDSGTLTRKSKHKPEWTDVTYMGGPANLEFESKNNDTWNENTCPDDVTFPTISGSVHMVSSMKSEIVDTAMALPDLLEKSEAPNLFSKPDLTDKLDGKISEIDDVHLDDKALIENIPEPSFTSLVDEAEPKFDSIMALAIEKEAARLAAQLKSSQYAMENSVTSLTSLDLDNVKPPSNLGSLLSLSASGHWDESAQTSRKSQKSRKKSLPVALMMKRALSNSMHQGSSEHLDSIPLSLLDNVKPPSEMENLDMDGSMISVSSIVSEVAETKDSKTPLIFDYKQPVQDFPLCSTFTHVFHDLDKVNPPSLFDEIAESTLEADQTTAHQVYDDCTSNTLNVITDIPSGSETCTPLPSDISSVESTPKRQRDPKYLTPKEKRSAAKHRYQTYTITDTVSSNDVVLKVESEEFITWTKSESDKSDEYVTANSESKSKRRLSAKQRRQEDRARYQTQTVNIHNMLSQDSSQEREQLNPQIESLKQRLAAKKTLKQKRIEDAERFRTRTLSEDIPPSPTFVTKDANFENVETTTGYDSLSSNELNHQQLLDDRHSDDVFRDVDSGHNEDDFELNSTKMKTYTKSFRNYLPVIESPASVDMCVVNNLKNIEMTASYRRNLQSDKIQNPSSSDFASFEGDSHSEGKALSESDSEAPTSRPKPKIIKPERRDGSLDSNESGDREHEAPKVVRGRKKALYVSPYRRNVPSPKKQATPTAAKIPPKSAPTQKPTTSKTVGVKAPTKTAVTSKVLPTTSPKKTALNKSPSKLAQKPTNAPSSSKPAPLVRQGTFTKEESSVPAKDLPVPSKKSVGTRPGTATSPTKTLANTSPSRLPQFNRTRTSTAKPNTKQNSAKRASEPIMKNSPSNHSLQSNDSGKTIVLARGSRQGSTSSVNSVASSKTKEVESKIANLWKKVEQTKKLPAKADKRVWIDSDKAETPKLIRSSTFEGQPKLSPVSTATKQKSAIGIRVSQIPSLRPKTTPGRAASQTNVNKKPANKGFLRKGGGQVTS
nr:uncharacterized protein LOC116769282 [Danaus plexippus plexippus]